MQLYARNKNLLITKYPINNTCNVILGMVDKKPNTTVYIPKLTKEKESYLLCIWRRKIHCNKEGFARTQQTQLSQLKETQHQCSLVVEANTSLSCCVTRINVVRLLSSLSFPAPTYVHVDRTPPSISCIVTSTLPRYGICTVLPSDALVMEIYMIWL